jgi:hypothetical protein
MNWKDKDKFQNWIYSSLFHKCVPIAILSSHSTPARPHCFFLHNQKLQTVLRGPPCSPLAFISLMPIVQCIKTSVGGEVGSRVGNSRIVYVHICEEISLPLQVWFDTTIYALHAGGDGCLIWQKWTFPCQEYMKHQSRHPPHASLSWWNYQ